MFELTLLKYHPKSKPLAFVLITSSDTGLKTIKTSKHQLDEASTPTVKKTNKINQEEKYYCYCYSLFESDVTISVFMFSYFRMIKLRFA